MGLNTSDEQKMLEEARKNYGPASKGSVKQVAPPSVDKPPVETPEAKAPKTSAFDEGPETVNNLGIEEDEGPETVNNLGIEDDLVDQTAEPSIQQEPGAEKKERPGAEQSDEPPVQAEESKRVSSYVRNGPQDVYFDMARQDTDMPYSKWQNKDAWAVPANDGSLQRQGPNIFKKYGIDSGDPNSADALIVSGNAHLRLKPSGMPVDPRTLHARSGKSGSRKSISAKGYDMIMRDMFGEGVYNFDGQAEYDVRKLMADLKGKASSAYRKPQRSPKEPIDPDELTKVAIYNASILFAAHMLGAIRRAAKNGTLPPSLRQYYADEQTKEEERASNTKYQAPSETEYNELKDAIKDEAAEAKKLEEEKALKDKVKNDTRIPETTPLEDTRKKNKELSSRYMNGAMRKVFTLAHPASPKDRELFERAWVEYMEDHNYLANMGSKYTIDGVTALYKMYKGENSR